MSLYEKHKDTLQKAIKANQERSFYAHYPEHPKVYGKEASQEAEKKFQENLGQPFKELKQEDGKDWVGEEISPYTQDKIGITYPKADVNTLIQNARAAYDEWRDVHYTERAGILVEALENIKDRFFDVAFATQHTTGQSFMMSFQASGPHANDRALEAIAMSLEELQHFPDETKWEKDMGKMGTVQLDKEWEPVPKGIALAIGVSTFPVWNSVSGVFASLTTGNPVIWKPHPMSILPAAIEVAEIQKVLEANGYNPNIIQLAVDTPEDQITKDLAEHEAVKVIDFTGSTSFGNYIESLEQKGKVTFTEKAGVNSVILHSIKNGEQAFQNLAFSVCLYSGQFCTAPQNFFIPESGIEVDGEQWSYDNVVKKLAESIQGLAEHPKMGPGTLGTIQNPHTQERINKLQKEMNGNVRLQSKSVPQEGFEKARTASPAVIEMGSSKKDTFSEEQFGPLIFAIKTKDVDESIQLAKELAQQQGAITCTAYCTDEKVKQKIKKEMGKAFAPVTFNLVGPIWVNQNAAFSDLHLTGGNPAGNAGFANPEFVQKRFVWVGHKEEVA